MNEQVVALCILGIYLLIVGGIFIYIVRREP